MSPRPFAVAIAALLVVAVAAIPSTGPVPASSNDRCTDRVMWIDFDRGLWAADATGSTTTAGLPVPDHDSNVAGDWSPDGETIAWSDGNHIQISDADGSNARLISDGGSHTPSVNQGPVISPDGRFVAWTGVDPQTDEREVYLSEIDGSHRRVLSRKSGTVPTVGDPNRTAPTHNAFVDWRSDSERIVWHGRDPDGYGHIYQSSRVSGTMQKLTDSSDGTKHAAYPRYSPNDDHQLVYQRAVFGSNDSDIVVDGQIVSTGLKNAYGPPAWSPDGTRVAWTANNGVSAQLSEIYHSRADGTDRTLVNPTEALTQNGFPAWSPDGTQLAWVARGGPHPASSRRVWIADADGSDVYLLAEETDAAFSPSWRPMPSDCPESTLSISGSADAEPLTPARRCAIVGCP